jgi:integral membrane sensor domain MASE1
MTRTIRGRTPTAKAVDEGTIHLISLLLLILLFILFSTAIHMKLHDVPGRSMSFWKTP